MLLTSAIIFAATAIMLEIMIVSKSPWLMELIHKYMILGILISIFLSWSIGAVFGAAGVTCAIAAGISTVGAQPYYIWTRWKERQKTVTT